MSVFGFSRASFALLVSAAVLALPVHAKERPLPDIHFLYPSPLGTPFDRSCKEWMNREFSHADRDELLRRMPEFVADWTTTGQSYIRLAMEAADRPFPYSEMQATLSVCAPDSMAFPLLISMSELLSTHKGPTSHQFSLLVFHELMHHYVQQVEAGSPIYRKYANEPPGVRAHIHVVALERYVLEKTGRADQLEMLHRMYKEWPVPNYRRAWEIVDAESVAAVVNDLRWQNELEHEH